MGDLDEWDQTNKLFIRNPIFLFCSFMAGITFDEMSSELFRKKRWSLKIRGNTKKESDKEEYGNGE